MSRLRWMKKERKLRRRFYKYSLCALICGVGISSINIIDGITSFEEISVVTEFDEKYRTEFLEEYEQILKEKIVFQNSELYNLLKAKLGK